MAGGDPGDVNWIPLNWGMGEGDPGDVQDEKGLRRH